MGDDPTDGLDADQLTRLHTAGYNALRARGWVTNIPSNASRLEIDQTLVALLLTCATAPRVVFIWRQPVDRPPETIYTHIGEHMTAIHHKAEPGIHELIGTIDSETTGRWLEQRLLLTHKSAPGSAPFSLSQLVLNQVVAAVRNGQDKAGADLLRQVDVPEQLVEEFTRSIKTLRANTTVALLRLDQSAAQPAAEGFALLEDENGFWLLQSEDGPQQEPMTTICPASADMCKARLRAMLYQ
jgi:hypothetical protein